MVTLPCGHEVTVDPDPHGPADEAPDGSEPAYCPRCGAEVNAALKRLLVDRIEVDDPWLRFLKRSA